MQTITNYPSHIEDKLDLLCEVMANLQDEHTIYEECVRDVFGPALLQLWFDGKDLEFELAKFEQLLKQTIAASYVKLLQNEGLVDVIENENGEDIIFLTREGKIVANNYFATNN